MSDRADEREPLLPGKQNGTYHSVAEDVTSTPPPDQETNVDEIAAQIEAIKENLPLRVLVISLASMSTCLFAVAVDGTLFITLLNDVSTTFSASDLSFWIGTSYMLSSCITAPIYGRINDIFGRKNAMICGVTLFLSGTALCAVAPSMLALIAARSLAGLGGGGVNTCFVVILGDLIPLRQRAAYQAFSQLIFSLGNVAGGPIGGFLNDWLGWRMTIAIQVPVLAFALFLQIFFLRIPDFPKSKEQKDREAIESELSTLQLLQKRLDFTGCLLLTATCISLMVALSFLSAGNLPFSDVRVWVNFAVSATTFVVLLWYEAYIAKEAILPLALFKNRMISRVVAYYFFSSVSIALFFYFPIYFRSVLLQSSSQTGVHFLSLTISTTVGSFVAGALLTRTGRYKKFMIFCCLIAFISPVNMSTWSATNVPSTFIQNSILIPFGFGGAAMSSIMVICVLASCPRESQATALGLVYLSRSLGAIVGVAVFGAEIQYVLTAQLVKHITGPNATEIIDNIRKNANLVAKLPDDIRPIALRAYSSAFRVTNIVIAVIFFISFLIVLPIEEIPLGGGGKKPASASSTPSPEEDVEVDIHSSSAQEQSTSPSP